MKLSAIPEVRTWIEISTSAIAHNVKLFRKFVPKRTKILGVVKSNAYGHELMGYAKQLAGLGVDWIGVDSIVEANTLRDHGISNPILVLGYTLPSNYNLATGRSIAVTLSSFEQIKALINYRKAIHVHIKIDTGMHRQGFYVSDIPAVIAELKKHPHIKVEGFYTHFAAAKKPDSGHETEKQITGFKEAARLLKAEYPNALAHAAATAGTLNYPEAHFDMVRIGIGLYGLWPSQETKKAMQKAFPLRPVMSWKSVISEIKPIEKNEKIGYDYTEAVARKSRLAIVPVGYWHGYWRAFSSKAHVLVGGKRCKVIGRVAMDMIVVDVTEAPRARVLDEVILLGSCRNNEIKADELAAIAGTTSYEIVTRLNPLIKKYYV